MDQRERFIEDERLALYSMTELCARYGVSRKTRCKWLERHLTVTARRCQAYFAEQMRWLVVEGFPTATVIRVVLDNLCTHTWEALYERFPPEEARRLVRALEFHYMPKHGSWLHLAEIDWSIVSRECLARRIPTPEVSPPRSLSTRRAGTPRHSRSNGASPATKRGSNYTGYSSNPL